MYLQPCSTDISISIGHFKTHIGRPLIIIISIITYNIMARFHRLSLIRALK